jgi:hypothetical protein
MEEIWKDIKNYEGLYQVSSFGNIKNIRTARILRLGLSSNGYYTVTLCNKSINKTFYVHRLIAETFLPNSLNKSTINHIDGNKINNDLSNLEWATQAENNRHAFKTGLSNVGEEHGSAKLTERDAKRIKYEYPHLTQTEIAKIYGVSHDTVSLIRLGKRWSHI